MKVIMRSVLIVTKLNIKFANGEEKCAHVKKIDIIFYLKMVAKPIQIVLMNIPFPFQ
jgi:hypothetical protein